MPDVTPFNSSDYVRDLLEPRPAVRQGGQAEGRPPVEDPREAGPPKPIDVADERVTTKAARAVFRR